jgi:hypothetical protein
VTDQIDTEIPDAPQDGITRPSNPDTTTDFRLPVEQLAQLRAVAPRRYLARIFVFGEALFPEERGHYGTGSSVIVRTRPELGPEMASSAIGVPLNLARRPDGVLCHWTPFGPGVLLHGVHQETNAGWVANAWPDRFGLMAELLVFRHDIIPDLDIAESSGELWSVGLCLLHTALDADITPIRFTGHHYADVRAARSFAVDIVGLPLSRGCRLLRRLEDGEEVREDEGPEPDARYILAPPAPAGLAVADAVPVDLALGSVGNPQLGTGAVGTGNLQGQAVTPQKRSLLTQVTGSSPSIPSGGRTTITLTHGLGFRPLAVPQSGHSFIIASVISMTTNTITILLVNAGQESASTTLTVDYF